MKTRVICNSYFILNVALFASSLSFAIEFIHLLVIDYSMAEDGAACQVYVWDRRVIFPLKDEYVGTFQHVAPESSSNPMPRLLVPISFCK